jgi:hypothetical protein
MWQELPGVTVDIVQYEPAVMNEKVLENGEHTAYISGYLCDAPDSDQIAVWFISGWYANIHNADISEVKPLILAAQTEPDAASVQAI